jgi:hypothetical protein
MKTGAAPLEVTVKHKGETFHATYTLEKGIVTVSAMGRLLSAHLGPTPPDILAREMLREIIDTLKPSNL